MSSFLTSSHSTFVINDDENLCFTIFNLLFSHAIRKNKHIFELKEIEPYFRDKFSEKQVLETVNRTHSLANVLFEYPGKFKIKLRFSVIYLKFKMKLFIFFKLINKNKINQ